MKRPLVNLLLACVALGTSCSNPKQSETTTSASQPGSGESTPYDASETFNRTIDDSITNQWRSAISQIVIPLIDRDLTPTYWHDVDKATGKETVVAVGLDSQGICQLIVMATPVGSKAADVTNMAAAHCLQTPSGPPSGSGLALLRTNVETLAVFDWSGRLAAAVLLSKLSSFQLGPWS